MFAGNELVLAVPRAEDAAVDGLDDLGRPGVTLVDRQRRACPWAPTRARCSAGWTRRERRAILANVRSSEPDVKGVVGKLVQGAADAGFVYRSDVEASGGELRGDRAATTSSSPRSPTRPASSRAPSSPPRRRRFLDDLREGNCHDALLTAGFAEPPP